MDERMGGERRGRVGRGREGDGEGERRNGGSVHPISKSWIRHSLYGVFKSNVSLFKETIHILWE